MNEFNHTLHGSFAEDFFSEGDNIKVVGWIDTGEPKFNAVFGSPDYGIPLGRIVGIIGGNL